jgi:Lar family restriction alleviation protein
MEATMTETKLKPCPFCGGKAELVKSNMTLTFADSFCVRCDNLGCFIRPNTPHRLSDEDAINIWNRRATDERAD